ncbi:ATP-binding protein [Sphingomonas paucimobilis]|uniref:tetratricopeptide repeat-containing sensor histidine kinase n=1 Tax=Sphingomonas paucimobilis TaxID=13689 RepID=UPI0028D8F90A|nr:ATP-binding protein [Sphingomonas paucimobilis]
MRALRVAIVALALLIAGAEARASVSPAFDAAVDAAKAEMLRDPDQAITQAERARRIAERIDQAQPRALALATAGWLRGEARIRLRDDRAARADILDALAIAQKLAPGSELHGNVLLSKGSLDTDSGNIAGALTSYQFAYRVFQHREDPRGQARALVQIANLYIDGKDYASALRYLEQARATYLGDDSLRMVILNNRSITLGELGRVADSLVQLRDARKLAQKLNSPALLAQVWRNIARGELRLGRVDAANAAIVRARQADPEADPADRNALLSIAAQAAFQRGQYAAAARAIDESFAGVDLATTPVSQRDAHQTAYRIYAATGRTADALKHLQALKRIDDESTRLATSTNLALMSARFDFANQELRIARMKAADLQRNIAFEREQLRTERLIMFGSVGAIIVVLGLLGIWLFTLGRSRNRIRAAHGDLAITNDRLEKALAVKTDFLATTSHEIRTPLNGILGMTQVMLADTRLSSDTRERVEVMHGAGLTMRALVDDLLDVAKIEHGRLTLEQAPFDLAATIREASRLWEDQAAAKGIGFTTDLRDCPTIVMGDSARIRQIVFNLLSNALKFTPEGRVDLSVSRQSEGVSIRVSDTGIGIPAEKLEEIFEAFRQADASTTRQFGGTGLGLAICRRLAQAMGGDVTVDSELGHGTHFTLSLPLVEQPVPSSSEPEQPLLLIVDRNPIRRAMWTKLAAAHARVVFAGSPAEAAARLRDGGVAQVLIDDSAIRDDGVTTALVSILDALPGPMPVALLWPENEPFDRNEFLRAELMKVIAKPVAGGEVIRMLFDASPQTDQRPLVTQAA